jgi:gliding motility-associated protein GldM
MAGQKETPRQKMIGMMYLVLTALLALQVSNAVLEKFAIINETLATLIKESSTKSEQTLATIIEEAGKSQKPEVLRAKENAATIRQKTKAAIQYIDELKVRMMRTSGSETINENVINDHSSKVATMMIDKTSKEQEGIKYEKLLNDYVNDVTQLSGIKFERIAKAPKEMELFKSDPDHAKKSFLEFTFENTPVIAALASVTQVQSEILEYEARALDKLREDAGAGTIRFDQFIPMVRPKSSVVAAGAKYEAEMFLTGSSTAISPEFYLDNKALSVIEDPETKVKMGKVEFTATGGQYDAQGLAKKVFKARINMNENTFEKNIEYWVAQPVIKVTTGNVPTLYMNCGNFVNIEVPSLGTNYNPSFNSTGATIVKGSKAGQVTIIPKQRKINVGVSNGGTPIGTQEFAVKNIPDPRYIAYIGNTPVDLRTGIRVNQLGQLRIVAEPDANFKEEVPKDARYRIKKMEIILGRGTTGVQRGTDPDQLRNWINAARPGDKLIFDIKDVARKTFTDEEEKVDVKGSSGIIQISII